jgi:lipopolysaccharide biosynthesis regulator YciM
LALRRLGLMAIASALIMAALTCSMARAAEVSRSEYREAAEPICRTDTQANERLLADVRTEVRQGKLGIASTRFAKAAEALRRAVVQLEALPRPVADTARLEKWFATVSAEAGYFEAVSRKLKTGQKAAAESLVKKLTVTAMMANNQVLPFEFSYCRLEPSRFT